MKRQKSKKRKIKDIIRIIVLLIALCVLIYPSVSSYLDEKNSSKVVSNYDKKSEELSKKEKNKMIRAARAYNRELLGNIELQDPFSSNKKQIDQRYASLLNVDGNGMMGYVRIPSIKVELPIYHGTSELRC